MMRETSARRMPWAALLLVALVFFVARAAEARAVPVVAVKDSNRLVVFESSAPGSVLATVTVNGLQGGEAVLGIDFRPTTGQMFALGSTGRLYVVNPATGAATLQAVLVADPADAPDPFAGLSGTSFGVDFNPSVDRLRVVSDTEQNLRINPNNGQTITDGTLACAAGDANAGQNPVVTGVAYTNIVVAAAATLVGDIGGGVVVRGIAVAPQGTIQFSAQSFSVMEDCTSVELTVTRTGDLTQPAAVDYATSDGSGFNPASRRSDYNAAFGTLFFDSGESSKTFRVLINGDSRDEKLEGQQGENFVVMLCNPTNGFFLSAQSTVGRARH